MFLKLYNLIFTGTLKGSVVVWDAARQMVRCQCSKHGVGVGVTKISWIKDNLVTGGLDGSIRIYDGKSGEQQGLLRGHSSEILDFVCKKEHNLILSASDDGTARIFKYNFS